MAFYSTREYWDDRYRWGNDADILEDTFDWYVPYGVRRSNGSEFAEGIGFREEFLALVPERERASSAVVILGCGISTMGEMMYDDGFQNILCLDLSERCILRMRRRQELLAQPQEGTGLSKQLPVVRDGLRYQAAAAEELVTLVGASTVDVVVEKAMIDAAFCDKDVQQSYDRVSKILESIYDALKPGGMFIHITSQKETSGAKGVLFHNPVLPWAKISAVKLDLVTAWGEEEKSSLTSEATAFFAKPYWMFCLTK